MSDAKSLYDDVILDHIRNARNFRELPDADRSAEGVNPLCGDTFTVYLKLDSERIREAHEQAAGAPGAQHGDRGAERAEDAEQVDLRHLAEALVVELRRRHEPRDAGVRDHDADVAEALEGKGLDAARQAVAQAKERLATNLSGRRDIEKELAVHQGRLQKYKDQSAAVKTNQEFHAIQHEMAFAQNEIRGHEDRMLERMRRPERQATLRKKLAWLREASEGTLAAYLEHETAGLVQVGARIQGIARHDRTHIEQLQKMAAAAARGN